MRVFRPTAAVRAIVPDENPLTRTRPVRFTPRFVTGSGAGGPAANQSLVVRVPIAGPGAAASVHKDAVVSRGGQSLVYVVNGTPQAARAEVRPIRIGESVGSRFVVLDGLRAGDLVVVRGNERITTGQAIRFKPIPGAATGARPDSGPVARSDAETQSRTGCGARPGTRTASESGSGS